MLAAAYSGACPAVGVLKKRKSVAFRPAMPVMLNVIVLSAPNELEPSEALKLNMMSYLPSQFGLKASDAALTVAGVETLFSAVCVNTSLLGSSAGLRLRNH